MKILLKIENLMLLLISLYIYFSIFDFSIMMFLLLLFVPDISMFGYIINTKIGSYLYNSCHHLLLPTLLLLLGLWLNQSTILMVSLIWLSHIFMDRLLGYGLKFPNSFHDTHLA